jgi:hypothetical protein
VGETKNRGKKKRFSFFLLSFEREKSERKKEKEKERIMRKPFFFKFKSHTRTFSAAESKYAQKYFFGTPTRAFPCAR